MKKHFHSYRSKIAKNVDLLVSVYSIAFRLGNLCKDLAEQKKMLAFYYISFLISRSFLIEMCLQGAPTMADFQGVVLIIMLEFSIPLTILCT